MAVRLVIRAVAGGVRRVRLRVGGRLGCVGALGGTVQFTLASGATRPGRGAMWPLHTESSHRQGPKTSTPRIVRHVRRNSGHSPSGHLTAAGHTAGSSTWTTHSQAA
jgi:hypothetical protein